jgi:hypothetical protein
LDGRHYILRNGSVPQTLSPSEEEMRVMALDLLEKSVQIKKYFSLSATKDLIRAEKNLDKLQRILTLFVYMEQNWSRRSYK